jgi:hypothetical protein
VGRIPGRRREPGLPRPRDAARERRVLHVFKRDTIGGESPAVGRSRCVVLKPYRHENEQFGYAPDYPLDARCTSSGERPYIVAEDRVSHGAMVLGRGRKTGVQRSFDESGLRSRRPGVRTGSRQAARCLLHHAGDLCPRRSSLVTTARAVFDIEHSRDTHPGRSAAAPALYQTAATRSGSGGIQRTGIAAAPVDRMAAWNSPNRC